MPDCKECGGAGRGGSPDVCDACGAKRGAPLVDLVRDLVVRYSGVKFTPYVFHNDVGDILEVRVADGDYVAHRMGENLSVFFAVDDATKVVGVAVHGASRYCIGLGGNPCKCVGVV